MSDVAIIPGSPEDKRLRRLQSAVEKTKKDVAKERQAAGFELPSPDDQRSEALKDRYDQIEREHAEEWLTRSIGASTGELIAKEANGAPQSRSPLDTVLGRPDLKPSAERLGAAAKDVGGGVVEAIPQAAGGARDAVQAALNAVEAIGTSLGNYTRKQTGKAPLTEAELAKLHIELPDIEQADTNTGGAIRKVAQFLVGFGAAGKAFTAAGMAAKNAPLIMSAAKGAVADLGFFDGQEQNLANAVQGTPLANPVAEFLASDPNDGEAINRLRNAVTGVMPGVVLEALAPALVALRAGRAERANLPPAPNQQIALASSEAKAPVPVGEFEMLGNPTAPLIMKAHEVKQIKTNLETAAKAGEAGVTEDVVAKALTDKGLSQLGDSEVYVNWSRIDGPQDIQRLKQDLVKSYEESTDAARRGVRTQEATIAAAEKLGLGDVLQRRTGQAFNAEELHASLSIYEASLNKLKEVANTAAQNPTPENLAQMLQMRTITAATMQTFYGARAEAGRALNILKRGGTVAERGKEIEALLTQTGGPEKVGELARLIAALPNEAVPTFLQKTFSQKAGGALKSWWYFSLLSNPTTHLVNAVSNASVGALLNFETSVASRVAKVMGDETAIEVGEAAANWAGQKAALLDALVAAGKTAKTGESRFGPTTKIDTVTGRAQPREISAESWGLTQDSNFGKAVDALGAVVDAPTRALMTGDEFFKTVNVGGAIRQQAFSIARQELREGKVTPEGFKARVDDLSSNPTDEMMERAVDKANYATFTDPSGEVVQAINTLRRRVPGAVSVMPFTNVVGRIGSFTFERTPLAPLMSKYKTAIAQGGREAYLARTRMALGTMLLATAMDWYNDGVITGGGPEDPSERQNWLRQGNQPWSVKMPGTDKWVQINRADPLATFLIYGAEMAETYNNMDPDDADGMLDWERAGVASAFALGEVMSSKSFMSGITEFSAAVNDPDRYAYQWAKQTAATLSVPGIVRFGQQQTDPVKRYTASLWDEIKAKTPGLSQTLPPRRDLWGREEKWNSGGPFKIGTIDAEPIDKAMQEGGWFTGMPSKTFSIDGVKVSTRDRPDIYSRLLELQGATKPSDLGKPQVVDPKHIKVVDGDTIMVGPERVRIVGLNAPELKGYSAEAGTATKERLEQLIESGQVAIDRRGQDKYGRTLAEVTVGDQSVAALLSGEGLAASTKVPTAEVTKLVTKYGDQSLKDTLNAIVTGQHPLSVKFDEVKGNADDAEEFINRIVGDYRRAARSVIFAEYPWILEEAERKRRLKDEEE